MSEPNSLLCHCQWANCCAQFGSYDEIEFHILSTHLTANTVQCQWLGCDHSLILSDDPLFYLKGHVLEHVHFAASCANTSSFLARCGLTDLECACSYPPLNGLDRLSSFQAESEENDVVNNPTPSEAIYGCRICGRGFQDETLILKHLLLSVNKTLPEESVTVDKFYCHWFGCNNFFSSYGRLHAHVVTTHNRKDFIPYCFWRHCENKWLLWSGTAEMERHLLLHVFLEHCLRRTKRALLKRTNNRLLICRGIEFQKTSYVYRVASLLLWQANVLKNGFICCWHGCDFRVNSANLFAEHVASHATPDFAVNDRFCCQWNVASTPTTQSSSLRSCDATLTGLYQFRAHLYRHTGLPSFVCETCKVCFTELPTFLEHFKWSIPDRPESSTSGGTVQTSQHGGTDLEELSDAKLLKCDFCAKGFVTKCGLSAHMRSCRLNPKAKGQSALSAQNATLTAPSLMRRSRRVAQSNALVAEAGCELEKIPKRFLCPVTGCEYETELYTAYRFHFKRYHSTINPDGLWYACHLCPNYRTRKPSYISRHLRQVHRLKPPAGRSRFSYSEDPVDGVYRLSGKPSAPKCNAYRPILPAPTVDRASTNTESS